MANTLLIDDGVQTLTNKTLTSPTLTGDVTIGENTVISLNTALSADGKYSGLSEAGEAGEALVFGKLCYFNAEESYWFGADANLSAGYGNKLGICVLAASGEDEPTKILLFGKVRADSLFPTLTEGDPVYMSETKGEITLTAPVTENSCIRKIGFGNEPNELFFYPSNNFILNSDRVRTITSSATPTINTDINNYSEEDDEVGTKNVTITALAVAITSFTTNLSGTPHNFQKLIIRIKDNGTARAIAWGAKFEDAGVALPTTTVISKLLTVGFIYNTVTAKWGCVAVANES